MAIKSKRVNVESPEKGILLPLFKWTEGFKVILSTLGFTVEEFSKYHAHAYIKVAIVAQVRSRAMSAGMKDIQDVLRLPSINRYIKDFSVDTNLDFLSKIYVTDKCLQFLPNSDPEFVQEFSNDFLGSPQANTKIPTHVLLHSRENLLSFAKGHYLSFISKLQTISIYQPQLLGRYSDLTFGMVGKQVFNAENYTLQEEQGCWERFAGSRFDDCLSLNQKSNLTPLEESLNLDISRTTGNVVIRTKVNENEKDISPLEKVRRERINKSI